MLRVPDPGNGARSVSGRGQLLRLKVSKQPKWYVSGCSLRFTVTVMWLPGEKDGQGGGGQGG
jgi:hypothetical protein